MSEPSLYSTVLGTAFAHLPPLLREIHDTRRVKHYAGRCDVRGGSGYVSRSIARLGRLPVEQSDLPVEITITRLGRTERWTRLFGAQRMQSLLSEKRSRLQERIGPAVITFALSVDAERILWTMNDARLAWTPLPMSWLLTCTATEFIEHDRYCFDVRAHLRGFGLLVHYRGWLTERGV
jgi:hypothetical protein